MKALSNDIPRSEREQSGQLYRHFPSYPRAVSGTPISSMAAIEIHVFLFDISSRRLPFHSTKSNLIPPTILANVSSVGHTSALQMPLLNATDDIHTQLPVLLQRVLPMRRDGVAQSQVSRDAVDHHLAHLIVFARVRVDILYPPQAGVCFIVVVEGAHSLHDVIAQLGDLELLAEEVEVEKRSHVLFGLWVAQSARIEPTDEELEGKVVGVGETEGFGFALAVLLVVEDVAEEGGMVAQELLVYRPTGVFRTHVDVHEG